MCEALEVGLQEGKHCDRRSPPDMSLSGVSPRAFVKTHSRKDNTGRKKKRKENTGRRAPFCIPRAAGAGRAVEPRSTAVLATQGGSPSRLPVEPGAGQTGSPATQPAAWPARVCSNECHGDTLPPRLPSSLTTPSTDGSRTPCAYGTRQACFPPAAGA